MSLSYRLYFLHDELMKLDKFLIHATYIETPFLIFHLSHSMTFYLDFMYSVICFVQFDDSLQIENVNINNG